MHCLWAIIDIQSIRDAIAACDESIFRSINLGLGTTWLDPIMIVFTILGIGATQVGIGFIVLTAGYVKRNPALRKAGCAALATCFGALLFSSFAKVFCERPRPLLLLFDVRLPDNVLFIRSFPSGHTAIAFAAGTMWAAIIPKMRWVFFAVAGLVGFSRVYLGVHFPFDVLYGAVLGTVVSVYVARMFGYSTKQRRESEPVGIYEEPPCLASKSG